MFFIRSQTWQSGLSHSLLAGVLLLTVVGCTAPGGSWASAPSLVRGQSPEPIAPGPAISMPGDALPAEELPAAEPRGPVLSVTITGNKRVSAAEIRRHIKTRQDRAYDAQLIQEDLRRLFATRKFQNVRVQKKVETRGVHVTFEVIERPLIGEVLFIGNRRFSDKKLLKEAGLEQGEALNIYLVQEARRKVEEFYRSKGFVKAQVTIVEGDKSEDSRVVLQVDEGRIERIWDVKFVGNDPDLVTDSRLKTLIKSKPGIMKYLFRGTVNHALIEEDRKKLIAYYRNLGYMQAEISREIDYDESGQWISLTFVISEGPRYKIRDISVVGNKKYDSQALIEYLSLKEGDYFNHETMLHDENALRDLYGSEGHIFADIKASPRFLEQPGELNLVYQIDEGELFRVGKINIHVAGDSPHTRRDVILNRVSLHPGDVIDIREVRASERRLKASQLFVTNPAEGNPPRIVIRPPDLAEAAEMAKQQKQYRGQSPDSDGGATPPRPMVLDVFVPSLSGDQR